MLLRNAGRSRMAWRRVVIVIATAAAMTGGVAGAAQAATPTAGQEAHAGIPTAARVGASESSTASPAYLSVQVHRDRGSGAGAGVGSAIVTPATARCPAFVTWEDWLGGARVHGYVDFHPSDTCNGRHVKDAYVRLVRQCGPYYDTGRLYTYTAGSSSDTALYSVSAWIFDSLLWGCNTNVYYGYNYF